MLISTDYSPEHNWSTVGLLILMAAAALLSMRMTRTVDSQLAIIDQNYFPAYVALAQANIRSVEESAYVRRLLLAIAEPGDHAVKLDQLRQQVRDAGRVYPPIEYPGEAGVGLQHLAILVGRQAHATVWPNIISWLHSHA